MSGSHMPGASTPSGMRDRKNNNRVDVIYRLTMGKIFLSLVLCQGDGCVQGCIGDGRGG